MVLVEEDDELGAAVLGDGPFGTLCNVETLRGVEVSGSSDTITVRQGLINISFHQATIRPPNHRPPLLRGRQIPPPSSVIHGGGEVIVNRVVVGVSLGDARPPARG